MINLLHSERAVFMSDNVPNNIVDDHFNFVMILLYKFFINFINFSYFDGIFLEKIFYFNYYESEKFIEGSKR